MAEEINQDQKNPEQYIRQKSGNNRNLVYILIAIIAVIVIFFFVRDWRSGQYGKWLADERKLSNNPVNRVYPNVSSGVENQGDNLTQTNGDQSSGAEVTAIYEKEKSQNQIFFKLYFNTHAVDYSNYDFQENVVIKDSQGKVYKAVNIAKEGAGHHQSVEMAFPLASSPFKLIVKNLADVAERTFSW